MALARPATAPAISKIPFLQSPWFAALAITAAALVAYHNSFGVPFVFDDELAIVGNPTIRNFWTALFPPNQGEMGGLPISGRPLVNVSVALNFAISGTAVWSYHVFNLLVHVACGCVFFGIVRRTLLQPRLAPRFGAQAFELALLASLLWTVHPLQTESVTYISQRAEALVGLFYFLTVWCFIRATAAGGTRPWAWGTVIACLLGMTTKEVMVSAPLFVALYDRAFVADSWREVWSRHRKLLLALASTWLVLGWIVIRGGGTRGVSAGFGLGVSPWVYLLTQCQAIVLYLKLSLWPQPLVLDYGTALVRSAAAVWWQGLLLLALLGGTVWALVRKPMLGCFGAWFFMILAPTSSVVPLVGQTIAEHRMYLPLAALVVLAVIAAETTLAKTGRWILAGCAVALTAGTIVRNQDYASAISICEDTVAKRPDNARAMALLADYYHRTGKLDRARHWLERSLEVQPRVVPVLNNLGMIWQELGNPEKAAGYFRQALARDPADLHALNNLGNALLASGHPAEGIAHLEFAVKAAPGDTGTRANLAAALAQSGRLAEAAGQCEALLKALPDDAETHANFSNILFALGRMDEGIAHLTTAVRLQPRDAELHNRLGAALGRLGRVREALVQFEEALRLNPRDDSARQNAARAQRMLGGN